ncbi:MAG: adenosylmethionine decarboxylase [Myxococcales bacterium]|nr:adenosylmethionine decarboxylase [Myxococcales bacterium]|tara:strand:- start:828 stop:1223 length:396 start_codon:yes stop_codon:yes gene_type:complete
MQLSIIVATLEGCEPTHLDDGERMLDTLQAAVDAGGFTMLNHYVHKFSPQGVTGAAVLSESHIALHSWPEHGVLFIDIATCSGDLATEQAFEAICEMYPHAKVLRKGIAYEGMQRAGADFTLAERTFAPAP